MSLLFLISDFQNGSFKIGLLRSKWINEVRGIDIVDISHDVRLNNTIEAAFIHDQIQYPENHNIITLFKIGSSKYSAVYQHNDRLYIMPNNGLIGICFGNVDASKVFLVENGDETKAANKFLENKLHELETAGSKLILRYPKQANIAGNMLVTECIFTDRHGNCYFNLKEDTFKAFINDRPYRIRIQHYPSASFDSLGNDVNDADEGDAIFSFSRSGYLKLQINLGSARQLFRIKDDTKIIIELK